MDRSTPSYLVIHYALLIATIFLAVSALELVGISIPLWAGVPLALLAGLGYPKLVRRLGVAPKRWER